MYWAVLAILAQSVQMNRKGKFSLHQRSVLACAENKDMMHYYVAQHVVTHAIPHHNARQLIKIIEMSLWDISIKFKDKK